MILVVTVSQVTLYKIINTVLVEGKQNLTFRYFPSAPVQLATNVGGAVPNGGAEAFMELQKALNIVGDYRLSSSINTLKWAVPANVGTAFFPENDYSLGITGFEVNGQPIYVAQESAALVTGSAAAGNAGSAAFAMAIDLETSNGIEISGLNAEEQVNYSTNFSLILL